MMARYNEILVGRYNRMVQKLLSMKGPASLVTLSDEVQTVFPLFYGVENRYLEGWDRFAVAIAVAAGGAGFNSALRFRNPTGSNVVAVFEKITFSGTVVGQPRLQQPGPPPPVGDFGTIIGLAGNRWDLRGRPAPTLIASSQNNAAFTTGFTGWQALFPANQSLDAILFEEQEITLLPGDALTLSENQTNVQLTAATWWRERFLEDSERA